VSTTVAPERLTAVHGRPDDERVVAPASYLSNSGSVSWRARAGPSFRFDGVLGATWRCFEQVTIWMCGGGRGPTAPVRHAEGTDAELALLAPPDGLQLPSPLVYAISIVEAATLPTASPLSA
jgi:hypothetical protein